MEKHKVGKMVFVVHKEINLKPDNKYEDIYISGLGTSVPGCCMNQKTAFEFVRENFNGRVRPATMKVAEKIFAHPSVATRYFAFSNPGECFKETKDERMARFTKESVEVSANAAKKALETAKVEVDKIFAIVVNTCTGYVCPGISSYLIEKLGLNKDIMFYDLVGAGCAGAIPNIRLCRDISSSNGGAPVLGISVEISSCAFRMEDDIGIIVSNAIFGDGAAAFVVQGRASRFKIINFESACLPEFREDIRFVYKDGELYNQLSSRLPAVAGESAAKFVKGFLEKNSLRLEDIAHWAVHSGGENIIKAIEDNLKLPEKKLLPTREILSEYGNMSSPTVLFVLERLLRGKIRENDLVLMLAFGAGFQIQAALLRKS